MLVPIIDMAAQRKQWASILNTLFSALVNSSSLPTTTPSCLIEEIPYLCDITLPICPYKILHALNALSTQKYKADKAEVLSKPLSGSSENEPCYD